ncbi:hypothetical protein SKAU_G00382970 [Synaphobranchus kaupii]|uniref:C-type lectin domain-containing protein n=1 Tax=Synaphobranchus kaupii TaxID=118154 RepID=A0A9Q1EE30_SYNKA|nr:hypothetical protein SKAU_G00382970 [Synaphobranchus kaupii]
MTFGETEFCQGPCPGGWTYHNRRCFQYVSEEANWLDAETHCLDIGGNLASEGSEDDHAFLKELQTHNGDSAKPFWIGLSDVHKEGTWLWSDGNSAVSPDDFTKWNSGEPNNVNNEDCVHSNFGDIDHLLPSILGQAPSAESLVVHVWSSDIRLAQSEKLKADFKSLIYTLSQSGRKPVISGPLPSSSRHGCMRFTRLRQLHVWLKSYCKIMSITFVDNLNLTSKTRWNPPKLGRL